jgi:murein DD-endopeptidase MepM/ murein hydrolase activator NlpD
VRTRRNRFTALLIVGALFGALLPTLAVAQEAEQRQLREARERLAALSDDIDVAVDEADDAEAELEDADRRLAEVEAVVNDVAAAVDRQRGAVAEAQQSLDQVEAEAEEVFAAFADRTIRMFKEGPNLSFQVLLGSDDVEGAMWRTSYLRAATQTDRANLEALDAAERRVEAERARLQEEQERLEGMLAEQEELLEEVTRLRESRALAAADARAEVERMRAEQDDLEGEQAALEELIREKQEEARRQAEAEAARQAAAEREAAEREAAEAAAAERARQQSQQASSGSSSGGGGSSGGGSSSGGSSGGGGQTTTSAPSSSGFAWPLCAPVTSEYGPRWGRMHRGIDQGASTGTPIGASKAGTVIYSGWQGGYGNLVLVDHHDGVVTAYAHMSRIGVSNGQSVSQGQSLGAVGSTGNSTGPHLHFETRVNGSAVNPRQYLSGNPC